MIAFARFHDTSIDSFPSIKQLKYNLALKASEKRPPVTLPHCLPDPDNYPRSRRIKNSSPGAIQAPTYVSPSTICSGAVGTDRFIVLQLTKCRVVF